MTTRNSLALLALSSIILVQAAWGASSEEAVSALIPKMAVPNVPDRYAAQMELQKLASTASKPGDEAARAELGKVLAAKAADTTVPQPARVWIIRQLEYMGKAEAVPALAKLLTDTDAEVRECSRRALEKNPAKEATTALREALKNGGDATWKVGLINALGQRNDTDSVALIIPLLSDEKVGATAALSLGKIASAPAVEALWKNVDNNLNVANALIGAANQLAARDNKLQARAIYEKLYGMKSVAVSARAAALAGLAKVDANAAAPLISQALTGSEEALQNVAVLAAPVALGKNCSSVLVELLPKLSPRNKVLVLNILDASAEKAVLAAAKDPETNVRLAAIEALGHMGGSASVPVLLASATQDVRAEKTAAESALAILKGSHVEDSIEASTATGEPKLRVAAINALANRSQKSGIPALLKSAEDTDASVRNAAFAALGKLASDKDMEALAKLAIKSGSNEATAALESAAQRCQDKPGTAKALLALATSEKDQLAIIDSLSALGGKESLDAVTKLANTEANREAAIAALGNWSDFSAAKPLLALIAAKQSDKLNTLTLQAIVRLVKASETEPADSLADTALAAMNAARSDDDKKLALSALGAAPSLKTAAVIKPLLADDKFKAEAAQAGITLAEQLNKSNKTAAKELAQAVKDANVSQDITRKANRILSR